MVLSRPRRKTTLNKSYKDNIDESIFEAIAIPKNKEVNSSKRTSSRGISKAENGKSENSTVPYNWQAPPAPSNYFSNQLDLKDAYIDLDEQTLYCPNHHSSNITNGDNRRKKRLVFSLKKSDYIYMVSVPPGEPYYIGRIIGFKSKKARGTGGLATGNDHGSDAAEPDEKIVEANDYLFEIQWFYRPRDISKSTSDTRLLFASMHTDTCPLQSYRGRVNVKHKHDIENEYCDHTLSKSSKSRSIESTLDEYLKLPNNFYFDKLFDRYMLKVYDVIPTSMFLPFITKENKNKNFLEALHKRFEFVFVETNRSKTFIDGFSSGSCNCEICSQWCSGQDSITCVTCQKHFHMICLDPPLLKKPSRGFSWSCALCTKKHDIEYQSKKIVMLSHDNKGSNERELSNELSRLQTPDSPTENFGSPVSSRSDSELSATTTISDGPNLPQYELMAREFLKRDEGLTLSERRLKEEWCMRYVGINAKLEDCIDVDDKSPYPKATTRIGARHQLTNIPEYENHPLVFYDMIPENSGIISKKKTSSKKNSNSNSIDPLYLKPMPIPEKYKNIEEKDYPQWLQRRPKNYIERGVDDGEGITCSLLWKSSKKDFADGFKKLDSYIELCEPMAKANNMSPRSPNFMDAIVYIYMKNNGDSKSSLEEVKKLTRESLREPTFTDEEIRKFEAGIKKHGSELYPVYKSVKTQPLSMIVRFYYLWKKTANGRAIWGNFEGRNRRKIQNIVNDEASSKANNITSTGKNSSLGDSDNDSAYDNEKVLKSAKKMVCKHCHTDDSISWHKITGFDPGTKLDKDLYDKYGKNAVIALCFRCARLWRRYAVIWENPFELEKKTSRHTGGWKRKVEPELLEDINLILAHMEPQGATTLQGLAGKLENAHNGKNQKGIEPKKTGNKLKDGSSEPEPQKELKSKDISGKDRKKPSKSSISKAKNNNALESKTKISSTQVSSGKTTPAPSRKSKTLPADKSTDKKIPKKTSVSASIPAITKAKSDSKIASSKTDSQENTVKKAKIKTEENSSKKRTSSKKVDIKIEKKEQKEVSPATKVADKKLSKLKRPQNEAEVPNKNVVKRQRKNSKDIDFIDSLSNMLHSNNYNLPSFLSDEQFNKKSIGALNKDNLKLILEYFKQKQLLDIGSLLQGYQLPNNILIDLPFPLDKRSCCICKDSEKGAVDEILICSACGTNVHMSCSTISNNTNYASPIKQWLCEACENDINPHHSVSYSCSLCLANETNYELGLFGNPAVTPDYLKPIYNTGKWCHLLCAMFNFEYIKFKSLPSLMNVKRSMKDNSRDTRAGLDSFHNYLGIEDVSEIFVRNCDSRCGICNTYNGSLLACDLCKEESPKYHLTCAQDIPGFKLGFKIIPSHVDQKTSAIVTLEGRSGVLNPILICPQHSKQNENFFHLRAIGQVTTGYIKSQPKPLIQIFLEDLSRYEATRSIHLSGPQLRAETYVKLVRLKQSKESGFRHRQYCKVLNMSGQISMHTSKKVNICSQCGAKASPKWWIPNKGDFSKDSKLKNDLWLCQICYHTTGKNELKQGKYEKEQEGAEGEEENYHDDFYSLLTQPMGSSEYGISDENDCLEHYYSDYSDSSN